MVPRQISKLLCCRQQDLQAFGGGLKSCNLRVRVQYLSTCIFHWFPVTPAYLHLCTVSSSVYIQLWNWNSLSYGVWSQPFFGVVYTVSAFPEHNYWSCGLEFQKLFSSCCSARLRAGLFGSGSHKLMKHAVNNGSPYY